MGCGSSKSKPAVDISKKRHLNTGSPVPEKLSTLLPQSGPLPPTNYWSRLSLSDSTQEVSLEKAQYSLKYAYTSLRGFYPDALTKRNQDDICAHQLFGHEAEQLLFAVFDGHGTEGHLCAQFAKNKLPDMITSYPHFASDPEKAFKHVLPEIHSQLHSSNIDDSMSGTTCIATLIQGRDVYIANVGDSRAVIAENLDGTVTARALSKDQTPFRPDEAARVRSQGAQVMTMAQLEMGVEVMDYASEEEQGGDPPRIWAPGANFPGTAFTRSLGDSVGKDIGVSADPEVQIEKLTGQSLFMVLASDGVFEFMNNQEVVDMVSKYEDVQSAAVALVSAAYSRWLENEQRTDDITAIVIVFSDLDSTGPSDAPSENRASSEQPVIKGGGLYRLGSKRRETSDEGNTSDRLMTTHEIINASHKNINVAEAAQRPKTGPGGLYNRITAIPDLADNNDRRNSTDADRPKA